MKQESTFLQLSEAEKSRIIGRVESDFSDAITDHRSRMNKFMRYYRMWRSRISGSGSADGKSNYKVPLTKWQLLAKWAIEIDSLFGDDAEIIADPTAPLDEKNVVKVGRYMTWRVFKYMKCTIQFIVFNFYKLLFGRAIAHVPYCIEKEDGEIVYDAPKFETLWFDNIVLPADFNGDLQKCKFIIHRFKATPQDLLVGEEAGLYEGIKENFEKIYQASMGNSQYYDDQTDEMTRQQDRYEGVNRENSQGDSGQLWVWACFFNWRMLENSDEAEENNLEKRDIRETPILGYYLPDARMLIGSKNLNELYPKVRNKRPFVTATLMKDGSGWPPGMAEVLEDTELEMTVNSNLNTDAGNLASSPMFGYRPASGLSPKRLKVEPGLGIPMDNPKDDWNVLTIPFNPNYFVLRQQELNSHAEKLFAINDQTLGRGLSDPRSPKTARGQLALIDQGSIRQSLDTLVLRTDFKDILDHIWQLDCCFADKETFFRATEEQAGQWFETDKGFGKITAEERFGRMDFDIKFATSSHSKEQRKEREMMIMQAILMLPIFQQNPAAQWQIADDILRSNGKQGAGKYMPKPAQLDVPTDPTDEWSLMLQGDDVKVHVMDNDDLHLEKHREQIAKQMAVEPEKRDKDALMKNISHVQEHEEQKALKLQQQAQAQAMSQMLGGLIGGGEEPMGEEMPPEGADAGGLMEGLQAGLAEQNTNGGIPQA